MCTEAVLLNIYMLESYSSFFLLLVARDSVLLEVETLNLFLKTIVSQPYVISKKNNDNNQPKLRN